MIAEYKDIIDMWQDERRYYVIVDIGVKHHKLSLVKDRYRNAQEARKDAIEKIKNVIGRYNYRLTNEYKTEQYKIKAGRIADEIIGLPEQIRTYLYQLVQDGLNGG